MLFLWETRENLVIETSLKSYLFISTKHRCLNAIRKNQYHERIHNQIYEKIKDQFEDPDYYFVNELTENIQKAIENLPETYRETFAMSRFGEKTNVQIAEKLGISVKTVEYRISQALKILRFKLKDYLPLLYLSFQKAYLLLVCSALQHLSSKSSMVDTLTPTIPHHQIQQLISLQDIQFLYPS